MSPSCCATGASRDNLNRRVMSTETGLDTLKQDVRYLMDRTAILDCIVGHARGCDRHDIDLITAAITPTQSTNTVSPRIPVPITASGPTRPMPRPPRCTPTTSRPTRVISMATSHMPTATRLWFSSAPTARPHSSSADATSTAWSDGTVTGASPFVDQPSRRCSWRMPRVTDPILQRTGIPLRDQGPSRSVVPTPLDLDTPAPQLW